RVLGGDEVGNNGLTEESDALVEDGFPKRLVGAPVVGRVLAGHAIDEDVEPARFRLHPSEQSFHLGLGAMIDPDRNPSAAGPIDQLGGFLDALGPAVSARAAPHAPPGAVDGSAALS